MDEGRPNMVGASTYVPPEGAAATYLLHRRLTARQSTGARWHSVFTNSSTETIATVLVLFGAANRDPAVFSDPDVFDPERLNSQQAMGFSRGAHSCLGIHVARLQLREGLRVFLDDIAAHDIRYDEGEWVHAMNISGYQKLPGALTWR